nr:MAG TPA: hypothetical protein [Caudoviricetes sp.]
MRGFKQRKTLLDQSRDEPYITPPSLPFSVGRDFYFMF